LSPTPSLAGPWSVASTIPSGDIAVSPEAQLQQQHQLPCTDVKAAAVATPVPPISSAMACAGQVPGQRVFRRVKSESRIRSLEGPHRQALCSRSLTLNPPQSWCNSRGNAGVGYVSFDDEEHPRRVLKPIENSTDKDNIGSKSGSASGSANPKSADAVVTRRCRTPSPSGLKPKAATPCWGKENQMAHLRQAAAAEDRKRARAHAAGYELPEQQAVLSARRRASASAKRWASDGIGQSGRLEITRQELFRRRDARIRRFLEEGMSRDSKVPKARSKPKSIHASSHDEEQVDLTTMEAEADALSEELCRPLTPPKPCPLPEYTL
jgi:hypothetical protein